MYRSYRVSYPCIIKVELRSSLLATMGRKGTTSLRTALEKCEKELLENVSINFLFAKGSSLSQNLLDTNRIYQIVEKIKELAR